MLIFQSWCHSASLQCSSNVRVERSAASLPHIEAALSKTCTSVYPFRSYRPRSRSNALLAVIIATQIVNVESELKPQRRDTSKRARLKSEAWI